MRRPLLAALLVAAAACSGEPLGPPGHPNALPTTTASASAAAPAPPAFRLPDTVVPVKIAATLTAIPTAETFQATADLDLSIARPTPVIWLHATGLTVSAAHLDLPNGDKLPARVVPGGDHFVGFSFDREIPTGPAHLAVAYSGHVTPDDEVGVFRAKEGADSYLVTQFEEVDARRVFPCFDEPGFKIPWQLTLRIRPADTAISNTPILDEKVDADGLKTVRFAQTKPLPSYLVAFAVGPFDRVDAGTAGKNATPIRLFVARGRAAETRFTIESMPKILTRLEDAFGVPYPYEKLDHVAVPGITSIGGMENAALITLEGQDVFGNVTALARRSSVGTIAHELAHQWFGDLVTMGWWDDLWLNEGFATWMGRKITRDFDPAYETELRTVERADSVMNSDGLLSARKIRQEIGSYDDIKNAFDGITYEKGAAVLDMVEGWLGAPAFQKGVRLYLERHAWKNASTADFLAAMSESSGVDVRTPFSSFLDQPGVPIVSAKLACDGASAKIALAQERFLPIGSKGSPSESTWQIPVCARYGAGKSEGRACTLLTGKTGDLPLPKLAGQKAACPDWAVIKEGARGYFRASYALKETDVLLDRKRSSLTVSERVSTIDDVRALVGSGRFPVASALDRLADLMKDDSPAVQTAAVRMTAWLRRDRLPAELHPHARRFAAKVIAPRARALGWLAKTDDSIATRGLRAQVLDAMIELGDDPKLFAEAAALTDKWLDGKVEIDPDSLERILVGAASRGDRKLFDRLAAALRTEKDARRYKPLATAIAAFREPALVTAGTALFLDPGLDTRMLMRLLWSRTHDGLPVAWTYVKDHFDAVMERAPNELRPYVAMFLDGFCDEPHRAEIEAFFKDRAAKHTGLPRMIAQSLERISLCVATREALSGGLRTFLEKQ